MGPPDGIEFERVVIGGDADEDYALLDADGHCIGLVRWDGVRDWAPPPDMGVAQVVRAAGRQLQFRAPPPGPRTLTPRQFMDALSMQRQVEVLAAARQNPLADWMIVRLTGGDIELDDPETLTGVETLRQAGIITQAEAKALLRKAGA